MINEIFLSRSLTHCFFCLSTTADRRRQTAENNEQAIEQKERSLIQLIAYRIIIDFR